MNTEHIPKEILDNPNINLSDNNIKDINYLNDTFNELKLNGEYDINSDDFKQLIIDNNYFLAILPSTIFLSTLLMTPTATV